MTTVDDLRARGTRDWKVSVRWKDPDGGVRTRHVLARWCHDPETAIGFARRLLRPQTVDIPKVYRREPAYWVTGRQFWRPIRDLLIIAESAARAPRHPWERLLVARGSPGFLSWPEHYRDEEGEDGISFQTWHFSCAGFAREFLDHSPWAYECPSCMAPVLERSFPSGPYHHGNPETLCLLCGRWTKKHQVRYGQDAHEIRHRGQSETWEDPEEKGKEVEKTITPDPDWVPAAEWRPADRLEASAWRRLVARCLKAEGAREAWWPH